MTTSPASLLLLALPLLGGACILESENVGETPAPGETDSPATDTGGGATGMATDGATGLAETGLEGGTATETGLPQETGFEESTGFGKPDFCLDMQYDCFGDEYLPVNCGSELACDMLMVDQPFGNAEATNFVNPDAATCILDGLAAGTAGLYRVRVEQEFNRMDDYTFDVHADGSVIERIEGIDDKSCDGSDLRLALQAPDHFDGCQALGSDQLVLECLLDIGTPDACTLDPLCD